MASGQLLSVESESQLVAFTRDANTLIKIRNFGEGILADRGRDDVDPLEEVCGLFIGCFSLVCWFAHLVGLCLVVFLFFAHKCS